jgi:uncharacterized protein YdhG (YjbR/CyaY superfamily)
MKISGGLEHYHHTTERSDMTERQKFVNIDDYLTSVSPESKIILEEIRKLILLKVPNATETISYQMPAFKLSRTFIYFAAFKKHIGIYPPVKADKTLMDALLPYSGAKSNLKFPLNQPIPYELIGRVVVALAKQHDSTQRLFPIRRLVLCILPRETIRQEKKEKY